MLATLPSNGLCKSRLGAVEVHVSEDGLSIRDRRELRKSTVSLDTDAFLTAVSKHVRFMAKNGEGVSIGDVSLPDLEYTLALLLKLSGFEYSGFSTVCEDCGKSLVLPAMKEATSITYDKLEDDEVNSYLEDTIDTEWGTYIYRVPTASEVLPHLFQKLRDSGIEKTQPNPLDAVTSVLDIAFEFSLLSLESNLTGETISASVYEELPHSVEAKTMHWVNRSIAEGSPHYVFSDVPCKECGSVKDRHFRAHLYSSLEVLSRLG